jgi:hypothetical protein
MPVEPHERFTPEESYQRRIDTGEWNPSAMTEEERLASRRFEAYHAFETMPAPRREGHPNRQVGRERWA